MTKKFSFLAGVLLAAGAAATFAVPRIDSLKPQAAAPPGAPTVGDFVLRYATTMALAGASARPEEARAALRKAGALGPEALDLSAPLTEGDVVRISGGQLRITTQTPDRAFSQARFSEFFEVFGPDLREAARRRNDPSLSKGSLPIEPAALVGDDFNPGKGGKGKGKGKGHSPHEP